MNALNRTSPLLLPLALMVAACASPNAPTPTEPGPSGPAAFPNAIGTTWEYAARNSVTGATDTLVVRVVDTVRVDGRHMASLWTLKRRVYNETLEMRPLYVGTFGDTVMFFSRTYTGYLAWPAILVPERYFLLSKPAGTSWSLDGHDSMATIGTTSLDLPAGHYDDVTMLEYTGSDGGEPDPRFWLKPHVGFVKIINRSGWFGDNHDEPWELIRFQP